MTEIFRLTVIPKPGRRIHCGDFRTLNQAQRFAKLEAHAHLRFSHPADWGVDEEVVDASLAVARIPVQWKCPYCEFRIRIYPPRRAPREKPARWKIRKEGGKI